jgi:hypothetical protein
LWHCDPHSTALIARKAKVKATITCFAENMLGGGCGIKYVCRVFVATQGVKSLSDEDGAEVVQQADSLNMQGELDVLVGCTRSPPGCIHSTPVSWHSLQRQLLC